MAFANLIDGRAIAAQIQGELTQRVAALKTRGVGPMTIAMLVQNTVRAAEQSVTSLKR